MAIDYKRNQAIFRDVVSVDDAEGLLQWLLKNPTAKIDLAHCSHLHPANLQVLMAAKNRIAAWPLDANLFAWLTPALNPK